MKQFTLFLCIMFVAGSLLFAQETFHVNGVHDNKSELYAFTNAKIIVNPELTIENGTMVIRKGFIESIGNNVAIPASAQIFDLKGKSIYPAFIDLDNDYGMPDVVRQPPVNYDPGPQMETKTKGAYNWNQAIKPESNAHRIFSTNSQKAEELKKIGFGAVLSLQHDGIARGSSVFVSLADAKEHEVILKERASANYSFDKGSSTQDYPSALMGAIALLRQTYYDAKWYASKGDKNEYNISLSSWNSLQNLPQIFETSDKLSALRAAKIAKEFDVQYIIRGAGDEYQRIAELKATGAAFIIPVNFPLPFDVEDPFDANNISLADMRNWEFAPTNTAQLEKNGIVFALTTANLKNKADFMENIRTAIKYGLSKKAALASLTTVPAKMIEVSSLVGTLDKGKIANFLIVSGDLFDKDAIIYQNWTQGKKFELADLDLNDVRGIYELSVGSDKYSMKIDGAPNSPNAQIWQDTAKKKPANLKQNRNSVTMRFQSADSTQPDIRLSGWISSANWEGKAQLGNGQWTSWSAKFTKANDSLKSKDSVEKTPEVADLTYPITEYGLSEQPKQDKYLITNATIWTNESEGILKNTDILFSKGKIIAVGKNLVADDAIKINGTGKNVTAGVIDEHSHIAISGDVNEGTQAVTSEVRIGDVVDCDDIQIYRQLAGGVTTSHLLHGSANPIGGQSQLIKLRWGLVPEQMKFEGADPFIKFALGENVKQSNWGDRSTVRFPQTRMGVEQVYQDAFTRAKEYESELNAYNALGTKAKASAIPPRRDIELDALVEIINSKRFITCHSYVQSEITMLMRVAEQFGFRVNTFTHILEGFKVADKMKKHGAGGSSFSDWWAYKYEVIDAIPYNGAILHDMGIVTAFNSDSPEMARRLNQEAAKAVKYGGISEEEALKFVTLNPAKLLHVDNRVGSLKAGKDADIVIWSDNPLSIYATVEKTFVDGKLYFDREKDKQLQEENRLERARLIQKMIAAKQKGKPTAPPVRKKRRSYQCDDSEAEH